MAMTPLAMALMGGGQSNQAGPAGLPQPLTPAPFRIGNTDVAGIYDSTQKMAMEKYKADISQQNAMMGGLAGLGGAALLGPLGGVGGLGKLFGGLGAAGSAMSSPVNVLGGAGPIPVPTFLR